MAQPVRRVIQDKHPEINEKSIYTLLIDGNNLLRQSFADPKINSDGKHYGAVFQFFLQIKMLLKKKQYDYVYVTFDDDNSGILRYKLYNDYKANRNKKYEEHEEELSDYMKAFNARVKGMYNYFNNKNAKKRTVKEAKEKQLSDSERFINENFSRERDIVLDMCEELCIRTVFSNKTEGDDIIAYYVKHKLPNEKIVIVSTDNDLTQLISDDVCVFNRALGKYLSKDVFKSIKGYPVENVVLKKVFLGDSSDNIGNIYGLSEKRLMEAMPEIAERPVTIEEVKERVQSMIDERISNKKKPLAWCQNVIDGKSNKEYDGDFYEINKRIIDLSEPLMTDDAIEAMDAMMHNAIDTNDRSFDNLRDICREEKITEVMDSEKFANFFSEFKTLYDKEVRRFKENSSK